jgi:hypothetical protein
VLLAARKTLLPRLSDDEADQVTAAGFLFPISSALSSRIILDYRAEVFQSQSRRNGIVLRPKPAELARPVFVFRSGRL